MVRTEEIGWSTLHNMDMKNLILLKEKYQDILFQHQKEKLALMNTIMWIQGELKQYELTEGK